MIRLSSKQKRIVEAPLTESIQVLASAGSGKTRVLTERTRYILENTKRHGIIALTFTNKAAEEVRIRLSDCNELTERAWIATIHSVAERILRAYGHMMRLPRQLQIFERDKDRMDVFIHAMRANWIDIYEYLNLTNRDGKDTEHKLREYMNAFSMIKRDLLDEEATRSRFPSIPKLWSIFQDYQDALLNSGGIDYDDLLIYARKLLLNQSWIGDIYSAKYKYLCVDEAQDLNFLQYQFLKALCGDRLIGIMMVGDPNQMIYGFNGSSSAYLCEDFVRDFSAHTYRLEKNYRSSLKVIKAANNLKQGTLSANTYALQGKVIIESHPDITEESKWIVSTINKLIHLGQHEEIEGGISLNKMVVIARNRFVFSTLQNSLRAHSIPYFLKQSDRMSEAVSSVGKILDYGIRVKLNPKDWVHGKKICRILDIDPPPKWHDQDCLRNLTNKIDKSGGDLRGYYSDLLLGIDELDSSESNIIKFYKCMRQKLIEIAAALPEHFQEVERSIEELEEFHSNWMMFRKKGLGSSLHAFQSALALGQLAGETTTSDETLMLSTVHTMKGLEKDIVFMMAMSEGIFPDYRAKSDHEIEEERNNAFVAVTRAKRWLYMSYPEKKKMPWGDERKMKESRFIQELRGDDPPVGRTSLNTEKELESSF